MTDNKKSSRLRVFVVKRIMSEIRFYHLERQTVGEALPGLLEKALTKHPRILVQAGDKSALKPLSDRLWSYKQSAFLPHGLAQAEFEDEQPVLLTAKNDNNPNNATMCVILGESARDDMDAFDLTCIIFDGHDADELSHARGLWKSLKDGDHDMTYWQQGDRGWEKKA